MSSLHVQVLIALTLLAYLIGGLPFGYWFVRMRFRKDIRTMGSGNIGATNVHRSAGGKAGLIVLLLDILKGLLAVFVAWSVTRGDPVAMALAASAVVVGHCFPVLLRFKGGKAVACFVGAFGFIAPVALLATAVVFFLAAVLSHFVSLGSVLGAAAFPFLFWWLYHPHPALLCASIFAGVLIIWRHRSNLIRLRKGNEPPFSFRRKAD